jgi:hypothetical protein
MHRIVKKAVAYLFGGGIVTTPSETNELEESVDSWISLHT